eukprot:gene2782-3568_t
MNARLTETTLREWSDNGVPLLRKGDSKVSELTPAFDALLAPKWKREAEEEARLAFDDGDASDSRNKASVAAIEELLQSMEAAHSEEARNAALDAAKRLQYAELTLHHAAIQSLEAIETSRDNAWEKFRAACDSLLPNGDDVSAIVSISREIARNHCGHHLFRADSKRRKLSDAARFAEGDSETSLQIAARVISDATLPRLSDVITATIGDSDTSEAGDAIDLRNRASVAAIEELLQSMEAAHSKEARSAAPGVAERLQRAQSTLHHAAIQSLEAIEACSDLAWKKFRATCDSLLPNGDDASAIVSTSREIARDHCGHHVSRADSKRSKLSDATRFTESESETFPRIVAKVISDATLPRLSDAIAATIVDSDANAAFRFIMQATHVFRRREVSPATIPLFGDTAKRAATTCARVSTTIEMARRATCRTSWTTAKNNDRLRVPLMTATGIHYRESRELVRQRLKALWGALRETPIIFMSATLRDAKTGTFDDFYRDVGLTIGKTPNIFADSPFDSSRMELRIPPGIEPYVSYKHARNAAYDSKRATAILDCVRENPRASLVVANSIQERNWIRNELERALPSRDGYRHMEYAKVEYHEFAKDASSSSRARGVIIYGMTTMYTGADLPGKVGAVIVTRPLRGRPNDPVSRYSKKHCGFEYNYNYDNDRKLVQAAGRLMRAESDVGGVVLLCAHDSKYLDVLQRYHPNAKARS